MSEKQMVIRVGKAFALKFGDVSVEGRAYAQLGRLAGMRRDFGRSATADLLMKDRFAAGKNVYSDNLLENVTMKLLEIAQRIDVKLKSKQKGLTMVEYAVAGSLITAAAVAAFTLLGTNVTAVINFIAGQIANPA